jgi:hypothetical protein
MKLQCVENEYYLTDNGRTIATTDKGLLNDMIGAKRLSKQNCDEIFGVVNIDKLAKKEAEKLHDKDKHDDWDIYNSLIYEDTQLIKIGFNKAMELNKDKLFTLHDMKEAYGRGFLQQGIKSFNSLIQSLQQPTEIEVRIAMGCSLPNGCAEPEIECTCEPIPSLDENGCLILWVLNT